MEIKWLEPKDTDKPCPAISKNLNFDCSSDSPYPPLCSTGNRTLSPIRRRKMRTRRCTYPAPSEALTVPVSSTKRRKPQSCNAKAKGSNKSKCIKGLWDLYIPSDLLQKILSRLGLKANIQASTICKAWCEAAVSVRKLKRRPWLFYAIDESSTYILVDPSGSQSQTYKVNLPMLKDHAISYYRDGWVLIRSSNHKIALFLNPFTNERFYLPEGSRSYNRYKLAFSAAPTSSSCVVISYTELFREFVIGTWRPGESAWTTHRFEAALDLHSWCKCVFANGMFYCLGRTGRLGVFDPCEATWNLLPVKPCPVSVSTAMVRPELMAEHEGDIFVICTHIDNSNPTVFKLNLKQSVWEEQRDLGGLTVFASFPGSLIISGLSAEERNRIYSSFTRSEFSPRYGTYYNSLGDGKSSNPPPVCCMSNHAAWVEPPDHFP